MLMEVKKDYKNAIISQVLLLWPLALVKADRMASCVALEFRPQKAHLLCLWTQCHDLLRLYMCVVPLQTLRSAIGMKESDEFAGLSSPKSSR